MFYFACDHSFNVASVGTVMGEERLVNGQTWLCTSAASICIISCIVSLYTIACIAINRYLYICWHDSYSKVAY